MYPELDLSQNYF